MDIKQWLKRTKLEANKNYKDEVINPNSKNIPNIMMHIVVIKRRKCIQTNVRSIK